MNIYKNNINKPINNNKEYCYLNNTNRNESSNIFDDVSSIYKNKYLIRTKDKEYETHLIGKTDNYLVTFDDEKIQLSDIISIEIIK